MALLIFPPACTMRLSNSMNCLVMTCLLELWIITTLSRSFLQEPVNLGLGIAATMLGFLPFPLYSFLSPKPLPDPDLLLPAAQVLLLVVVERVPPPP